MTGSARPIHCAQAMGTGISSYHGFKAPVILKQAMGTGISSYHGFKAPVIFERVDSAFKC